MSARNIPGTLLRRDVIGALVSVAVILVAVTFIVSPGDDGDPSQQRVAVADSSTTVRAGEPAPDFVVGTLAGVPFQLSGVLGRPVWINVWASWCPPCRAEMPDIDEVRRLGARRAWSSSG